MREEKEGEARNYNTHSEWILVCFAAMLDSGGLIVSCLAAVAGTGWNIPTNRLPYDNAIV